MKILIHSNAGWTGTGYGTQTKLVTDAMREAGHEVIVSAYYGLQGATFNMNGITVLPVGFHSYGDDVLYHHYKRHNPDVLLTLHDIWVLSDETIKSVPLAAWTPVDHLPIPPAVLSKMQLAKYPIAMSRFGQTQLQSAGVDPVYYMPHVYTEAEYFPAKNQTTRDEVRKKFSIGKDTFVVAVVAANKGYPSRKSLPAIFKAWAKWVAEYPDSKLMVHSEPKGRHSGLNLYEIAKFYGLTGQQVLFPDEYPLLMGMYAPQYLNEIYQVADVKLSPSAGEGFGVTDLDAQAAGCPVIVTDFSAQAELGEVGYKIPVTDDDLFFTIQGSEQVNVRPSQIIEGLRWAKKNQRNSALRDEAVQFAQQYEIKHVWKETINPLLEMIANDDSTKTEHPPERQQAEPDGE